MDGVDFDTCHGLPQGRTLANFVDRIAAIDRTRWRCDELLLDQLVVNLRCSDVRARSRHSSDDDNIKTSALTQIIVALASIGDQAHPQFAPIGLEALLNAKPRRSAKISIVENITSRFNATIELPHIQGSRWAIVPEKPSCQLIPANTTAWSAIVEASFIGIAYPLVAIALAILALLTGRNTTAKLIAIFAQPVTQSLGLLLGEALAGQHAPIALYAVPKLPIIHAASWSAIRKESPGFTIGSIGLIRRYTGHRTAGGLLQPVAQLIAILSDPRLNLIPRAAALPRFHERATSPDTLPKLLIIQGRGRSSIGEIAPHVGLAPALLCIPMLLTALLLVALLLVALLLTPALLLVLLLAALTLT